MNTAYVFLQTGYADWEAASALAELRRTFGFTVKSIGVTSEPVLSMGGLRTTPDLALADFVPHRQRFSFSQAVTSGPMEKSPKSRKPSGS